MACPRRSKPFRRGSSTRRSSRTPRGRAAAAAGGGGRGLWAPPRGAGEGSDKRKEGALVDVRSIEGVPASPEHQGTVPVWWLFKPREMKAATLGGYLELVSGVEG